MPDQPNKPEHREEWVIVLTPLPSDVPAVVRIRHLLKRALRDWKLRCIVVRDPTPEELALANTQAGRPE